MMIDSLAHINLIRENNPDLNFCISAIPAEDGYSGERGIPYASWGIGVAENSEHKADAFKLVQFLMSKDSTASCRRWPTRSPATRGRAGLRRGRRAVQDGLRDLPSGLPGERVHRPARGRGPDAPASASSSRRADGQQSMSDALKKRRRPGTWSSSPPTGTQVPHRPARRGNPANESRTHGMRPLNLAPDSRTVRCVAGPPQLRRTPAPSRPARPSSSSRRPRPAVRPDDHPDRDGRRLLLAGQRHH